MPSRRRRRSKNLGTNLAEVQRRLRYLERRPVRTKLQRNVVTTAAIAVNAVGPDEVSFGTTIVTDQPVNTIENPKDGLLVINETAGTTSVFVESNNDYVLVPAVDTQARDDAETAQTTADGKNKIFRQNNAPTSAQGPSAGDLWYDQDDDNKMYRYTGTAWSEAVVLGNNALASISASKITAGTIDANAISVINLNASNISTGTLNAAVIAVTNISASNINTGSLAAARIATTALNADNITSGTIEGIVIKTSDPTAGSPRRIELTDGDDFVIYNGDGTRTGTITSVDTNWDFTDDKGSVFIQEGTLLYGGQSAPVQGSAVLPAIVLGNDLISILGGTRSYLEVDASSVRTYGDFFISNADVISLAAGYGSTDGYVWYNEIVGPLVLSVNSAGPLSVGTGAPSSNGSYSGQIVFRYTNS